jgi:acyl-CoA dehydrogenase
MAWDFETDESFQSQLDWASEFVGSEVMPLDVLWRERAYEPLTGAPREIVPPLKQRVRDQGLWGYHLSPELGGAGRGQVENGLLNEILGRSHWAPVIFGSNAPDSGNAEIIAHFGTTEQRARYLQPLLDGEIFSCFSMTEPQGGADPAVFATHAERDGTDWILNGEKYFSTNAHVASFFIVMAWTSSGESAHRGMSMFLVPADTPGIEIVRRVGVLGEPTGHGMHSLVRYANVRLPGEALLGAEGQAFAIAQTRLGGGRIHHAMRSVGLARWAMDMMCERAVSRHTAGSRLADKQAVQAFIADSWAQLEQFRLFVLQTAWKIDKYRDYLKVRKDIAAIKVLLPKVLSDIVGRAIQVHGAIGVSTDLPLARMMVTAASLGLADGPTEVHQMTVTRQLLRDYTAAEGTWPSQYLPELAERARAKYAGILARYDTGLGELADAAATA